MGRPRKYATNAEKQAAYRLRQLAEKYVESPARKLVISEVQHEREDKKAAGTAMKLSKCAAYVPRGTKCKLCGRNHA